MACVLSVAENVEGDLMLVFLLVNVVRPSNNLGGVDLEARLLEDFPLGACKEVFSMFEVSPGKFVEALTTTNVPR